MRRVNIYGTTSDLETQRPTIASSDITEGDGEYTFTKGNGRGRIVVASYGFPVTFKPLDRVTYPTGKLFKDGQRIIVRGDVDSFSLSGLKAGLWYVSIFEWNGFASNEKYLREAASSAIVTGDYLLTEDDFYVLQENGFKIIL
jgi:hypothetical protein